jgi:hypothetical protein
VRLRESLLAAAASLEAQASTLQTQAALLRDLAAATADDAESTCDLDTAAKRLSCSAWTLRRLARAGKIVDAARGPRKKILAPLSAFRAALLAEPVVPALRKRRADDDEREPDAEDPFAELLASGAVREVGVR